MSKLTTWRLPKAAIIAILTPLLFSLTACMDLEGPAATPSLSATVAAAEGAAPLPSAGEEPADGDPAGDDPADGDPESGDSDPTFGYAVDAAYDLEVKGRAPKTGYSRDMFGSGWVDTERNGCDTRNDLLQERLTGVEMSGDCVVTSGTLADPYTDEVIEFVRGGASEVDIDHMVALSDAWQKGATGWEFAKRVAFANDPLNLEPVAAWANRQKGDGDAATWLPPNTSYRCEYVARQIAVKVKYELWVTEAELEAMTDVLDGCPDYHLPGPGDRPTTAENTGGPAPSTPSTAKPKPSATTDAPAKIDPKFRTCKEAVKAGYGNYVSGKDPEYDWYRDRDGDGVVCESR